MFEAVGNVIISYGDQTIYGQKASLSVSDGRASVTGNVRYISPKATLYSSQLEYNLNTGEIAVDNARIVSGNYIVLGKKLRRQSEGVFVGEDAEYTTCKDCPESWSVFGRKIHITMGEYIRIWHAYIKSKGVIIMYIPYIILPIKQGRESGLLFPNMSFSKDEGVLFQLPYYWAIDDQSDATLTPSLFGKRGYGGQFEYRHVLGEKTWFEMDSLYASDAVYAPYKHDLYKTGRRENRFFGSYEHHFSSPESWNHHFYFDTLGDLDMVRDFDFYASDKIKGPDIGASSFLSFRRDKFQVSLEGNLRRNQIFPDPRDFDDRYVQILPRLSFSTSPLPLYGSDSPFLKKILVGVHADYSVFRQNHAARGSYIRNASRINGEPYIRVNWGKLGPLSISTRSSFDFQYYGFRPEEERSFFLKRGMANQTEIGLSLGRVYGQAVREKVAVEEVAKLGDIGGRQEHLIEPLPSFEPKLSQDEVFVDRSSYKHGQDFILKHYFLGDQKTKGNSKFLEQISFVDGRGQFDHIDAIRSKQHLINQRENLITIPISNTLEFQWNNTIIRKKHKPYDPSKTGELFDYKRVAFFDLSQGYDMGQESSKTIDKLTRLNINTGYIHDNFSVVVDDYYFHSTKNHIFNINYAHNYGLGSANVGYSYDALSSPTRRLASLGLILDVTDWHKLMIQNQFDMEDENNRQETYGFLYSPPNDCWKLDLRFERSALEDKTSFNFYVNFNESSFRGLDSFY